VLKYFSYEHFYVIYCKFWELDSDHDFLIDRNDLAHYSQCALSFQIVDQVFEQVRLLACGERVGEVWLRSDLEGGLTSHFHTGRGDLPRTLSARPPLPSAMGEGAPQWELCKLTSPMPT